MGKDMQDQLKICFGQTFEIRLRTLQLKCMQYIMDSSWTMAEHLRIMGGIIYDLKAIGKKISEREPVLKCDSDLPG